MVSDFSVVLFSGKEKSRDWNDHVRAWISEGLLKIEKDECSPSRNDYVESLISFDKANTEKLADIFRTQGVGWDYIAQLFLRRKWIEDSV